MKKMKRFSALCMCLTLLMTSTAFIFGASASTVTKDDLTEYIHLETFEKNAFTADDFTLLASDNISPTLSVSGGTLTATNAVDTEAAVASTQNRAFYLYKNTENAAIYSYSYQILDVSWQDVRYPVLFFASADQTQYYSLIAINTGAGGADQRAYRHTTTVAAGDEGTTATTATTAGAVSGSPLTMSANETFNAKGLGTVNYNWKVTVGYECTDAAKSAYTATIRFTAYTKDENTYVGFKEYKQSLEGVVPAVGFYAHKDGRTYSAITLQMQTAAIDYSNEILTYINNHPIVIDIKNAAEFNADDYVKQYAANGYADFSALAVAAQTAIGDYKTLPAEVAALVVSNGYYSDAIAEQLAKVQSAAQTAAEQYADAAEKAEAFVKANPIVEMAHNQAVKVNIHTADSVVAAVQKAEKAYAALSADVKEVCSKYDAKAMEALKQEALVYRNGAFEAGGSDANATKFTSALWDVTKTQPGATGTFTSNETDENGVYTLTEHWQYNYNVNNTVKMDSVQNELSVSVDTNQHAGGASTYVNQNWVYPKAGKMDLADKNNAAMPERFLFTFRLDKMQNTNIRLCVDSVNNNQSYANLNFSNLTEKEDGTVIADFTFTATNFANYLHGTTGQLIVGTVNDGAFTGCALTLDMHFLIYGTANDRFTVICTLRGGNDSEVVFDSNKNGTRAEITWLQNAQFGFGLFVTSPDYYQQAITVTNYKIEYFDSALLAPTAYGTSIKADETIGNQDLAFKFGVNRTAALPEGYTITGYGAALMTNASLTTNYLSTGDLLTLGCEGKYNSTANSNATAWNISSGVISAKSFAELPATYYVQLSGTAATDGAEINQISGTRFAARGYITYYCQSTNVSYTLYANNDFIGSDGETRVAENGQINRSLIGCAKNIIQYYSQKGASYGYTANENIFEKDGAQITVDTYINNWTGSTTSEQKAGIIAYIKNHSAAIQQTIKNN